MDNSFYSPGHRQPPACKRVEQPIARLWTVGKGASGLLGDQGPVRYAAAVGLIVICLMPLRCATELSPAEKDFYARSDAIDPGDSIDKVKRRLGKPTRIVDGERACRGSGGEKEWVYESLETSTGRSPLRGGSVVFCVSRHGVIAAKYYVHH